MSFQVSYTLQTLGNPPPRFYVEEAFWWCDGERTIANARRALRQCGRATATAELLEVLRSVKPQRGGPKSDRTPSSD